MKTAIILKYPFPGIALALTLSIFNSSTANASSLPPDLNPCWDITGQGQQVVINGVPNSGVMQFNPTAGLPAFQHEACLQAPDNDVTGDSGPILAKGWVWDTNLGWISMYCGDEDNNIATPLTNLGVLCGAWPYGVYMEGYNAGATKGRLHGFAWGDNAGYISFNCGDPGVGVCATSEYYIQPDVSTTVVCTGEINKLGCTPTGAKVSHIWSDNVGWLDLTGVRLPWKELMEAAVVVTLDIRTNAGIPLASVTKSNGPVADGNDNYQIKVKMVKIDGTPIAVPGTYTVNLSPVWLEDSVRVNQTTGLAIDCKTVKNCAAGGVSKPVAVTDFTAYGVGMGAPDSYWGLALSVAPTTGFNIDNSITPNFSYENFIVKPVGITTPVPPNRLILDSVQASVRNVNGICAFGTISPGVCGLKPVGTVSNASFDFVPPIELMALSDSISGATIEARYLTPNNLSYRTACRGIFAACGGVFPFASAPSIDLIPSVKDTKFIFVSDALGTVPGDGADCTDPGTFTIPTNMPWSSITSTVFTITPVFPSDGLGGCQTEGPITGKDASVYSVVRQFFFGGGGRNVSYFSNKLPRKTGSLVFNPVADVKGSVYSSGVSNPQTGAAYRSLGDISTNVLREQIARNVYNLIGGAKAAPGGIGGTVTISGFGGGGFVYNPVAKMTTLQKDEAGVPKVYHANGNNVIFENWATDISWTGERTIIVIGADVYIKSNLYVPAGTASPKPKLGIIVLKDEKFDKGGNIYIAPNVTNIQANIYADGSAFSYVPALGISAIAGHIGEPAFYGEEVRKAALMNQLFIEGSIASQNTIGGAAYTPKPILGDGSVESADEGMYTMSPAGRSRARLYDLNYLRYFGLVYQRMPAISACEGEAVDQQHPTLCPTDPLYSLTDLPEATDPDGDLIPVSQVDPSVLPAKGLGADQNAAEYILFDPPTATLPGFSVSTGAEVKIGPQ